MGGAVSAGKSNDELIDHLVEGEFIKSPMVQHVFRSVDRGDYYTPDQKENAYRDIAWRMGNLHLSAPCVYSEVMEALKLKPGLSFLNLGSGSGYLSTMAGLFLGLYGTNHGVELYSDVVDYANIKLQNFLKSSSAVDKFDFCEPIFQAGNCLQLDSSCQMYDRIYCGASCPEEYEPYVKSLVKVGGILIMPYNEKLLKITRTTETTWQSVKVLSVSFTPLIPPPPSKGPVTHIKLGDFYPPRLEHICRSNIRSILRKIIDLENPNLVLKQRKMEKRQKRQVRRIVIPIFDESDLSNSQSNSEVECDSDSAEYTINSRIPSRMSCLLEDFLRRHAELQTLNDMVREHSLRILEDHNVGENSQESAGKSDDNNESEDADTKRLDKKAGNSSISKDNSMKKKLLCNEKKEKHYSSPKQPTKTKGIRTRSQYKRKHPNSDQSPSTSSAGTLTKPRVKRRAATVVWKRIIPRDSESEEEKEKETEEKPNDEENYSVLMVKKIEQIPLPAPLLRYLNYRRDNL